MLQRDKGQVCISPGMRLAATRYAFGTLAARLENLKERPPKFAIHYRFDFFFSLLTGYNNANYTSLIFLGSLFHGLLFLMKVIILKNRIYFFKSL